MTLNEHSINITGIVFDHKLWRAFGSDSWFHIKHLQQLLNPAPHQLNALSFLQRVNRRITGNKHLYLTLTNTRLLFSCVRDRCSGADLLMQMENFPTFLQVFGLFSGVVESHLFI